MFSKILLQNTARNVIPSQFYSHRLFLFFSSLAWIHAYSSPLPVPPYLSLYFPFSFLSLFSMSTRDSKTYGKAYTLPAFIARYFCRTSAFGSQKKTRARLSACNSHSRRRRLMEISRNDCQVQKQCNEEFKEACFREVTKKTKAREKIRASCHLANRKAT